MVVIIATKYWWLLDEFDTTNESGYATGSAVWEMLASKEILIWIKINGIESKVMDNELNELPIDFKFDFSISTLIIEGIEVGSWDGVVGRFIGWEVGRLEGLKVGLVEGWNSGWYEGCCDGRLDGSLVGWDVELEGWKDGWLEGRQRGQQDGWCEGWRDVNHFSNDTLIIMSYVRI